MARLLADATKISGIKYDMSSLSDVYSAIHVVQTEMGITGTTAKEASSTIQGSFAAMKSAWENFTTGMADPDQDMGVLLDNLVDSVVTFGENIVPRIVEMAPRLVDGITQLGEAIAPALFEAGEAVIPTLIESILTGAPQLLALAVSLVQTLVDGLGQNAPMIAQSAMDLILTLVNGLTDMAPSLIDMAFLLVESLATALVDNAGEILVAALELVLALIEGIVNNIPKLIDTIFTLITKLVETILNNLPRIIEMGLRIIVALIAGIIAAMPQLIATMPRLIFAIINAFKETDWGAIGRGLLDGIKNGILDGWDFLVDTVKNLASSLFNAAKHALGIHSPSTKFKWIGEMSMEGAAEGFEDKEVSLRRTVSDLYSGLGGVAENSINMPPVNMTENAERNISVALSARASTANQQINVPLYLNDREIARATAWSMGEQLAWEEM